MLPELRGRRRLVRHRRERSTASGSRSPTGSAPSTRAAASSAVALGALRASRRSGGSIARRAAAHAPHAARDARPARRDDRARRPLGSGHVHALRARRTAATCPRWSSARDGAVERVDVPAGRGLGGRASPRPARRETTLAPGRPARRWSPTASSTPARARPGCRYEAVATAALGADPGSAADTVRHVHRAVLAASGDELRDDATAVCLAVA